MTALALFLALVLATAAWHKLADRQGLTPITARLAGASPPLAAALLVVIAAAEVLAALALLMPALRTGGSLTAAAIWLAYGAALLRHRGAILDCGCDLVRREKPIGTFTIARPLFLAAIAVAIAGPSAALPWTIDAPFAALAFLAIWFAAGELAAIPAFTPMSRRTR